MHQGLEKDYAFLLSKLIPRHILSHERQAAVRRAVTGGNRIDMIGEAYRAMEELVAKGVFLEKDTVRRGDEVRLAYARSGSPSRITLVMSGSEWIRVSGVTGKKEGILPSVLAGIISSLSLNDSPRTMSRRLEEILDLSGSIMPGAEAKMLLLQELFLHDKHLEERIKNSSWSETSKNEFYSRCFDTGAPYEFVHLEGGPATHSFFTTEPGTRSVLLVPLESKESRWGVLEVHLPGDEHPDREESFNFFLLGQGLVRMLENNKHLEKMVSIDRLTQLHNRNHYDEQLPLEMERAIRNRKSLAFLIMDIDDFKMVNDRYGHDVGDQVLKLVAHGARDHLRKIDLLFRYGGEEFIALLPGAGKEAAERTAERIREVVSKLRHTLEDGREVGVTISIGGCIFPNDAQKELDLFRKADDALYHSKREGKNRVTFYDAGGASAY
ncbi:MAG TPA: sensor domain-containing diguanylate cyclase [Candidatus Eisenbacteria bacterium]|uniref:Sensor domain-containing diguanylate cyclase n=1 Tax=Eiseniibacteriota bacterium TaxID=2212470 RepID=A0A7V2F3R0_UNCEI|nr:sensor domain-containing diguanylate cyclase [Candidatus Eisenbacteria bacterium]